MKGKFSTGRMSGFSITRTCSIIEPNFGLTMNLAPFGYLVLVDDEKLVAPIAVKIKKLAWHGDLDIDQLLINFHFRREIKVKFWRHLWRCYSSLHSD